MRDDLERRTGERAVEGLERVSRRGRARSTSNAARRQPIPSAKEVAFSPIFFVAGTKILVTRSSTIYSYRDLRDKTVVVTAGTTNEPAVQAVSEKQHLGIKFLVGKDHNESLATIDDVLLYGLVADEQGGRSISPHRRISVLRPLRVDLSQDDPDFAFIVDRTFGRLAQNRELVQLSNKWFQHRLPTGETLDLPMSPQLEEIFRVEGVRE